MNRRGFALLAVLWLIVALSGVAVGAMAMARTGSQASRNRVLLARAGWARQACIEIIQARWQADSSLTVLDTVHLGRGTWCAASVSDPAARLNLNLADSSALREIFDSDSLAAALIEWREREGPLASVAELSLVRGFDRLTLERIASLIGVAGEGRMNVNSASEKVLLAGSGLPDEAIAIVLARRTGSRPIESLDELLSQVSPPVRSIISERYSDLTQSLIFYPAELEVLVTGGISGSLLTARCRVTAVPTPGRLAIVRQRCA